MPLSKRHAADPRNQSGPAHSSDCPSKMCPPECQPSLGSRDIPEIRDRSAPACEPNLMQSAPRPREWPPGKVCELERLAGRTGKSSVRPQIPACCTVAGDDVDLPSRSNLQLNGIKDADELLMAVVLHTATDDDDAV